jgi:hypothetical protein
MPWRLALPVASGDRDADRETGHVPCTAGSLPIIGRSGGPSPPAHATLTGAAGRPPARGTVAITPALLPHLAPVPLRLPVSHA